MITPTIGIPRALFYYYQYPLWKGFFNRLGLEVILSPQTDKSLVDAGIQAAVDEACFPVKIFYGHTKFLANKVDYLFLPRLISVEEKRYICPKFMGLPDMIRNNLDGLPQIIDVTIDASKNPQAFLKSMEKAGGFFTKNKKIIRAAWYEAIKAHEEFKKRQQEGLTPVDILEESGPSPTNDRKLKIGLLGHGYNIYDSFASMNIIRKLRNMGLGVITPEMIDERIIEDSASKLPKRLFWTLGKKVMGSIIYLEKLSEINGLIHIASFGCGPDSLVGELAERYVQRTGRKPFLALTIDEHTGEAGLNTRLEAFVDMLKRREVS